MCILKFQVYWCTVVYGRQRMFDNILTIIILITYYVERELCAHAREKGAMSAWYPGECPSYIHICVLNRGRQTDMHFRVALKMIFYNF